MRQNNANMERNITTQKHKHIHAAEETLGRIDSNMKEDGSQQRIAQMHTNAKRKDITTEEKRRTHEQTE